MATEKMRKTNEFICSLRRLSNQFLDKLSSIWDYAISTKGVEKEVKGVLACVVHNIEEIHIMYLGKGGQNELTRGLKLVY